MTVAFRISLSPFGFSARSVPVMAHHTKSLITSSKKSVFEAESAVSSPRQRYNEGGSDVHAKFLVRRRVRTNRDLHNLKNDVIGVHARRIKR
jgi:hypothetical protein